MSGRAVGMRNRPPRVHIAHTAGTVRAKRHISLCRIRGHIAANRGRFPRKSYRKISKLETRGTILGGGRPEILEGQFTVLSLHAFAHNSYHTLDTFLPRARRSLQELCWNIIVERYWLFLAFSGGVLTQMPKSFANSSRAIPVALTPFSSINSSKLS